MPIDILPENWRDLFVMIGTSAASLVGLLFIVMSLYFNAIRQTPDYSVAATVHAARNNTYHLLTAMVTAALVLVPQPSAVLGAELAALHLYGLRLPVLFTWKHFIANHAGFPFSMIVTIGTGYSLGVLGGVALMLHSAWSLYLVAASCIVILVRSVLTAWILMFGRREAKAGDAQSVDGRANCVSSTASPSSERT
jgi:hypothetical protein